MINRLFALPILLCAMLLLAACASQPVPVSSLPTQPPLPEFSASFAARPDLPTPQEIHLLTPAQEGAFLQYFNHPLRAGTPDYQRVLDYLYDSTWGFAYESITLTAAEALESNRGNCLSLAILTTALARLANVEIHYHLIDSRPVFEQNGSLVNKEVHVRSILYEAGSAGTNAEAPRRPAVYVDYFPVLRGRIISNIADGEYLAMYYLNMAAEEIAQARYSDAFWHAREALDFDPFSAPALNMMAVIHRRMGDHERAENIYLYGIEHAEDKLSLLKNYRLLLSLQGRDDEAAAVQARLETMDDPSPFHWMNLARESYDSSEYPEAVRYFDKALALAPYLHEAHLGKAQSHHQMGQPQQARAALKLAIDNVFRVSTRSLYEAKLQALAGY